MTLCFALCFYFCFYFFFDSNVASFLSLHALTGTHTSVPPIPVLGLDSSE